MRGLSAKTNIGDEIDIRHYVQPRLFPVGKDPLRAPGIDLSTPAGIKNPSPEPRFVCIMQKVEEPAAGLHLRPIIHVDIVVLAPAIAPGGPAPDQDVT